MTRKAPRSYGAVSSAARVFAGGALFFLAMAGCLVIVAGIAAVPDPPALPNDSSIPNSATNALDKGKPLGHSNPVRVDITAIGVHAPVVATGTDRNGDVAVPPLSEPYRTNWYNASPSPGQGGNAVILGHVDSQRVGAAVFYRLGTLPKGGRIKVTRQDGIVVVFAVTGVAVYAKSRFPTSLVYGPSKTPGLR